MKGCGFGLVGGKLEKFSRYSFTTSQEYLYFYVSASTKGRENGVIGDGHCDNDDIIKVCFIVNECAHTSKVFAFK